MGSKGSELEDQDESVRIAVKALGDMRKGAQQQRTDASTSSTDTNSPFVSRMSHLPLVNSALRVYKQGKASSRVVKYGAEMMESSVKTISRPVIDRLPVNVNELDEFACRQLDRLDRYRRPPNAEYHKNNSSPTSPTSPHLMSTSRSEGTPTGPLPDPGRPKVKLKLKPEATDTPAMDDAPEDQNVSDQKDHIEVGKGWKGKGNSWLQTSSPFVGNPPPPPNLPPPSTQSSVEERQVAQRSRWQAVLLEAGGLSAALSEESMRRLKYCLQWLQYATAHIDAQILILRDFTASLQPLPSQTRAAHPPISQAHLRTLTAVRRDIIQTVKQVVDVVSRYAGGALPEPARGRVRGFILGLPQRWAQRTGVPSANSLAREEDGERDWDRDRDRDQNRDRDRERDRESVAAAATGGAGAIRRGNRRARERGPGASSTPSSRAASPMTRHTRHQDEHGEQPVSAGAAILTAQRILTLATESLDMMRGVTGVVKDSLDRADAWVGRLRTVGLQNGERQVDNEGPPVPSADRDQTIENFPLEPDFSRIRHRRGASSGSHFDDNDGILSPYSGASSSYSSYAGGSSVPSTPGAGTYTPVHSYSRGLSQLEYAGNAPSPNLMGLGLSSMTLEGSRFGTPKSLASVLPDDLGDDEDIERDGVGAESKDRDRRQEEVKIVGMDVEGDAEDGLCRGDEKASGKMDVDV